MGRRATSLETGSKNHEHSLRDVDVAGRGTGDDTCNSKPGAVIDVSDLIAPASAGSRQPP